jgi:acyl-CoA synthetase (AMP-forming)/AMP-acid ligase II
VSTPAPPEWDLLRRRPDGELAAAEPGSSMTVAELRRASLATAAQLRAAGVVAGDRVVVALPNGVAFVSAYLGVRLCGAVLVNVPWQWRRELVHVVTETGARAAFLDPRVDAETATEIGRSSTTLGAATWFEADTAAAEEDLPERDPDSVAWLAYTSGTTGQPKGAVHTETTMRLMADGFVRRYGLTPGDVVLVAAPVGHAVGFVYGVELALSATCPMVLMPTWEAVAFAQLTVAHRCTFVAAATPFLFDVVDHAERYGAADLESLRVFLCGGAPVSTALLERARAGLPQTDATAYYGTSECGGVATCPPDAPDEKKLTTDGLPLPGMEIRIESGELQVRGPQLARGYWGARDQGRFRADGWFATGDEATVDADGYVRIGGRLDDRIVRGGVNVSPLEIEEVLGTHPLVREVAVSSTPDERLGERIGALVVAEGPAPTLDDLRRHCDAAGLAKVKWPELVASAPELPRSPSGKLLRTELRRLLAPR